MKAIEFKGANIIYGIDQKEYMPLPALKIESEQGEVFSCWKLSLKERLRVLFSGRVWLAIVSFNNNIQPSCITTKRKDFFTLKK